MMDYKEAIELLHPDISRDAIKKIDWSEVEE